MTLRTGTYQALVTRVDGFQVRAQTEGIPETAWARPLGAVTAPQVGDAIWLFFEDGDPEHPIWAPMFSDIGATVTGDKHYQHNQGSPASVWTINHDLAKRPAVQIEDSLGRDVEASIEWPDIHTVVITFSASISGKAYLN